MNRALVKSLLKLKRAEIFENPPAHTSRLRMRSTAEVLLTPEVWCRVNLHLRYERQRRLGTASKACRVLFLKWFVHPAGLTDSSEYESESDNWRRSQATVPQPKRHKS